MDLDAWGFPIAPPEPPILDPELGLTTSEDAADWAPVTLAPPPVTRATFAFHFWAAGYGLARTFVCRHRLQYGRNRRKLL